MSLLMDALKKAELAKNQSRPGSSDERTEPMERNQPLGFPSLSLEPIEDTQPVAIAPVNPPPPARVDPVTTGPSHLPELPTNLQGLDAQFIAHHATQAPRAPVQERVAPVERPAPEKAPAPTAAKTSPKNSSPASTSESDRAAARNLFETKEGKTEGKSPASKRTFAILAGVFTLVSGLGIGGYFWWQLQPKNGLMASSIPPRPAPPVTPIAQAQGPQPATLTPPAAVPPAPTFTTAQNNDDEEEALATPVAKKTPVTPPRQLATPNVNRTPDGPIHTTKKPLQVHPALASGYEFFNRGEYTPARKDYERVLAAEPQNTDALHGLAAIAMKENRPEAADYFYQRILVADPKDSVALSGMLGLRGNANPGSTENQLRSIATAQPELAAPMVALGNLYSSQNRWNEAQQAYFNAYASEPENPDLLFNLAVSLEHLRKPDLAAQYYRQALAAARLRAARFDPAQAEARLRALQP